MLLPSLFFVSGVKVTDLRRSLFGGDKLEWVWVHRSLCGVTKEEGAKEPVSVDGSKVEPFAAGTDRPGERDGVRVGFGGARLCACEAALALTET